MGRKENSRRLKARYQNKNKFRGNRYTKQKSDDDDPPATNLPPWSEAIIDTSTLLPVSATRTKLAVDANDISNGNCSDNVAISGSYVLIDSEILNKFISDIGRCPDKRCDGELKFENKMNEKRDLACKLVLMCCRCK